MEDDGLDSHYNFAKKIWRLNFDCEKQSLMRLILNSSRTNFLSVADNWYPCVTYVPLSSHGHESDGKINQTEMYRIKYEGHVK